MNTQSYIKQINEVCKKIKNETDQDNLNELLSQLYQFLEFSAQDKIEFSEQQLLNIKQTMQDAFTSIVDNGILTMQEIAKPSMILDNIDVTDVYFNNEKVASKILNVGLVALLMSCATIFSDVVKNQDTSKVNIEQILKNSSSSQVAKKVLPILKLYQGTVKGNVYDAKTGKILYKNVHVVYDDNNGSKAATPWDGKSDLNTFIKNCKGTPTIGYGVTDSSVVSKGFLTDKQADSYLTSEVESRIETNKNIVGKQVFQSLTYNQQACLIALWYNVGSAKATPKCVKYLKYAYDSKLDPAKKKLSRNEYLKLAAKQFLDCNKVNGKEVKGLTNRVNYLNKLFLQDVK